DHARSPARQRQPAGRRPGGEPGRVFTAAAASRQGEEEVMVVNTKPTGKRWCAYLRVSTKDQDTNSQRLQIIQWAAAHGATIDKWYEDHESRDKAEKRSAFQQLLRDLATGLWDVCVIDAPDRLGIKHGHEKGKFICQFLEGRCQLWEVAGSTELTGTDMMAT